MFNERGFPKAYNLPGTPGGETSGLYAAVTVNNVVPASHAYLDDNAPQVFDDWTWDDFGNLIGGASQAYQRYYQERQAADAARRQYEMSTSPGISQQWQGLSFFEKAGFAFAIGGFAFLLLKK